MKLFSLLHSKNKWNGKRKIHSGLERAKKLNAVTHEFPSSGFSKFRIALKDNFVLKGTKTSCGSAMLKDWISPYTATIVQRAINAGGFVFCKTNMDEFGMGSTGITSVFGPTLNAFSEKHVAGGSSSGTAVAVATGAAELGLGSDTGGSIRLPAAWNGIVGFKPSYGRFSRYGLVAYASSMDTPGLLTQTVKEASHFYDLLKGHDPLDSTSLTIDTPKVSLERKDLSGLVVGVPQEFYLDELPESVLEMWDRALEKLKQLGASVVAVSLPHTEVALSVYYTLATAEAYSNLARFDGIRFGLSVPRDSQLSAESLYFETRSQGFGEEVKRRMMLGSFVLSRNSYNSYYRKAQQCRRLIKSDYEVAFSKVSALVFPTAAGPAFQLDQVNQISPIEMYSTDLMTVGPNLAGIPAISIPYGQTPQNLPLGLQICTNFLNEELLFQISHLLEIHK